MNASVTNRAAGSRLLLFPTDLEHRRFEAAGGIEAGHAMTAVCGFGVAAAAARTASLLTVLRPRHVLLAGIAGSFDEARFPVGTAYAFSRVRIDGIGKGEGTEFAPPSEIGIAQWESGTGAGRTTVHEVLPLVRPAGSDEAELLTVCSAAATIDQAHRRKARWPEVAAEEMEGFSVALAGVMASVPVTIVRGISNVVGISDPRAWKIDEAIAAVRELVGEILERDEWIETS